MTLKLIFMGTPAFAMPTLQAIHAAGHDISCVYSQPPRAAGRRGLALTRSPVALEAERLGLDVLTPLSLKDEAEIERLRDFNADVAVVVAYGLLLAQAALDAPRHGCLNGHGSLLPRWRGAAPIQRAIEAGDAETGLMVMRMEAGLDTGPVALTKSTAIGADETAADLSGRLSALCAEAMVEALARLEAGILTFEDQAAIGARSGRETVYARKIDKAETRIGFGGEAAFVARRINAFSPFPGAWTMADVGTGPERVKLLRAVAEEGSAAVGEPGHVLDDRLLVACGSGAVRILELQRAGGRAAKAADFLRGVSLRPGAVFGEP